MNGGKKQIKSIILIVALAFILFSTSVVYAKELKEMSSAISVNAVGEYTFNNIVNFGYYSVNSNSNKSTESELIHHSNNSSVSAGARQNGEFFTNINLSEQLTQAGKNGYLTFSASAQMHTINKKVLFDGAELLKMTVRQGSATNNFRDSFVDLNSTATNTVETRSLEYEQMSITNVAVLASVIRLQFTSEAESLAYINTMYVKSPKISFHSTDSLNPVIEKVEVDKTGWSNTERKISVYVNDTESGIGNVTVNGEQAVLESKTDDTKSCVYSFYTNENIAYNIQTFDNVGNSTSTVYAENNLDFINPLAPQANLSSDWYYSKEVEFNLSNLVETSEVSYFYTIDGTLPTNSSNQFYLGNNKIIFEKNGIFTLTILAVDQAENKVVVETILKIDDTVYNVKFDTNHEEVVMQNDQQYNRGQILEFSFSIPSGYIFSKLYCNNEDTNVDALNHVVYFSCEVDKNFDIKLVMQKIITATVKKEYYYNGNIQQLEYTLNDENARNYIDILFLKNNEETDFLNSGEYNVTFSINNNDYFLQYNTDIVLNRVQLSIDLESYLSQYNGQAINPEVKNKMDFINYQFLITYDNKKVESIFNSGIYALQIIVDDENYYGSANFVYEVKSRLLNIYADNIIIKYGEELSKITYTYSNLIAGDEISGELQKELGYSVGDYKINIGSLTAKNYDIVFQGGVYSITPREIVIKFEGNFKTYGDIDPEIVYTLSGDKILQNDKVEINVNRVLGESVGSYKYTVEKLANNNYSVVVIEAKLRIAPKKVMITLLQNYNKIYGESDPTFEYKLINGGVLFGDNLNIAIGRNEGESVGFYNLKVISSNANYQVFMAESVFEILKKEIIVTAKQNEKIYGEPDSSIVFEVSNLLEGDSLDGGLIRKQGEKVGAYEILLGTLNNSNYTIKFITNNFYINKRSLTVSPLSDQFKVYGEKDEKLQYSVDNLLENDILAGVLSRERGETAGTYKISVGSLSNENYIIELTESTYLISKRTVVVSALGGAKQYGQIDGDIKYETKNLVNGDTFLGNLNRVSGENVGTYDIGLGTLHNSNYDIEFNGNVFTITKAKYHLNLNAKTEIFNNKVMAIDKIENLPFEVRYVYTLNGVEVLPLNVGLYDVVAMFEGNENYEASESEIVTLTILQREVFLTVVSNETIYNNTEQSAVVSLSLDLPFSIVYEKTPLEIGSYNYTINIEDTNYHCGYSGIFNINEAITFGSENRVEANHMLGEDEILFLNIIEDKKELSIIKSDINKTLADRGLIKACRLATNLDTTQGLCKITLKIDDLVNLKDIKVFAKYGKDFMELQYEVNGTEISFSIEDYSFDYVVTANAENFFKDNALAIGGGGGLLIGSLLFIERKKVFKKKEKNEEER